MKDFIKIIGGVGIFVMIGLLLWLIWTDEYKLVLKLIGTDVLIMILCFVIDRGLEEI